MSQLKLAVAAGALAAALVTAAASAASSALDLGPAANGAATTYLGYYDGHKDTYVVTDVSSKSLAATLHVDYSPPLARF
jgi:hypothetical protein